MKQRVCSGNGGFNPQAFAQLRQTFCPADKPLDMTKLPAQVLDRFKGTDGQVDQARLTQFRTRVCSIDPAQFAARQGQQGQGGAPQGNAQAGGGAAQGNGGGPRGGGAGRGGGGRGGGGPGAFFMNRGQNNGGRWNLSLTDSIELTNAVLIAPGGPALDQLHGDAVSGNGVPRNTLSLEGGAFYNGLGLRFNASYKSGTDVRGSGLPGSSDLHFGSLFTLDLRMFADLGRQAKLVKSAPFFKNARISFSVNNVFDARQRVTDQNGQVPLRYQPYLVDPNGPQPSRSNSARCSGAQGARERARCVRLSEPSARRLFSGSLQRLPGGLDLVSAALHFGAAFLEQRLHVELGHAVGLGRQGGLEIDRRVGAEDLSGEEHRGDQALALGVLVVAQRNLAGSDEALEVVVASAGGRLGPTGQSQSRRHDGACRNGSQDSHAMFPPDGELSRLVRILASMPVLRSRQGAISSTIDPVPVGG